MYSITPMLPENKWNDLIMLFYNQNRQKVDHGQYYVTIVWGDPKWLRGAESAPHSTDHQISTTEICSNTFILIENHWNNAVIMFNSQLSQNMHLGPSYVMLILGCPEMVEGGWFSPPSGGNFSNESKLTQKCSKVAETYLKRLENAWGFVFM